MQIAGISFTKQGNQINQQLQKKMDSYYGYSAHATAEAYGLESPREQITKNDWISQWTRQMFQTKGALIFIGATGIAVRAIAPFVKDKYEDPAVLVIDERGRYVIPILSGHMGGANELAEKISKLIGATAVITTATDLEGVFAVDEFARRNDLLIGNRDLAKQISVRLLSGERIGISSAIPLLGALPSQLYLEESKYDICISPFLPTSRNGEDKEVLFLYPRMIYIGVGCKKGIAELMLLDFVREELEKSEINPKAVKAVASIDLKAEEPALLNLCKQNGWDFQCYSAEKLLQAEGEFTDSSFVEQTTGVGNICERAAIISSGGRLLQKKTARDGMTLAIAIRERSVQFG